MPFCVFLLTPTNDKYVGFSFFSFVFKTLVEHCQSLTSVCQTEACDEVLQSHHVYLSLMTSFHLEGSLEYAIDFHNFWSHSEAVCKSQPDRIPFFWFSLRADFCSVPGKRSLVSAPNISNSFHQQKISQLQKARPDYRSCCCAVSMRSINWRC